MRSRPINTALFTLAIVISAAGAGSAAAAERSIWLTQQPLVMRLSKDEFRIAFGIEAGPAAANGCHGVIRYRVDWKAEDGTMRSEIRRVNYTVSPRSSRSITVDRQYFDTAEAEHTTEVVRVSVDRITCLDLGGSRPQLASAVAPAR
jgi:hypothetical protein